MASYYGPFAQLEDLGILDVILPFILVFTLVFAILQKTKIFGENESENKRYNAVVALVMGLAVVFPHVLGYYPPNRDIVNIINQSLPNVGVIIVAIVMALIIIGLLGRRFQLAGNSLSGWIAIAAFGAVVYIFGDAASWWESPAWVYFLGDTETVTLVVALLIFAIIIWFITKEDEASKINRMREQVFKGNEKGFTDWEAAYKKRKFEEQIKEMLKDPNKP